MPSRATAGNDDGSWRQVASGGAQAAANVFQSFAWADPMLGLRWSAPLLDRVSVRSTALLDAAHLDR